MIDLSCYADARGIIRVNRVADAGHRSAVRLLVQRGQLIRLARGAYLDARVWGRLTADERYRARIHAAAGGRVAADELLCGPSALALWRLPALRDWPDEVHSVRRTASGGRRTGLLVRHATARMDGGSTIDGLPVTSLARTVADVSAAGELGAGLMAADAALRGMRTGSWVRPPLSQDDLVAEAEARPKRYGRSRALTVARLADARAESPGESLLRASIHLLGLPMPELQWEVRGDSGRRYVVDCYWPDQDFVLEFDGKAKYLDPALRGGRTAEEVVVAEKEREDEIRAQVRGMTRAGWTVALAPKRLEARLRAAGFRFP